MDFLGLFASLSVHSANKGSWSCWPVPRFKVEPYIMFFPDAGAHTQSNKRGNSQSYRGSGETVWSAFYFSWFQVIT